MRIDAHQHFWHHDPVRDTWITDEMETLRRDFLPQELLHELEANAVDGSVAVQADTSEEETRFLLEIARRYPFVLGVVGWVDLCAPDLEGRLRPLVRHDRLRGIRHIVQAEPDDYLARREVMRGIGTLADFGLTYDLLVFPRQLPTVLSLLEALPDQAFVLDHMAKPLIRDGVMEPWGSWVREVAAHPNVWCKVSGLVTEADWGGWRPESMRPYLDVVFDAFGPRRLMFGSDWPVCTLAASYRQVLALVEDYAEGLSPEDRDGLFGANAMRFYGLNPQADEAG